MTQDPKRDEADMERGTLLFLRARESNDPAHLSALARWIGSDDDRRRAIEALSRVWRNIGEIGDAPELAALRRRSPRVATPRWVRGPLAMAASVALTITIGAILWLQATAQRGVDQELSTAIGERRQFLLSDGTSLMLDAASKVRIYYSADQRIVRLEAGQARFRVAHSADRPFHVEAGNEDVRALGTEFNVAKTGSSLWVSLMTGSVLISRIHRRQTFFDLRRDVVKAPIATLMPGQQYQRLRGQRPRLRRFDARIVNAWQSGRLVFESLPLPDAVELVNRYSPRPVALGREIPAIEVSGVFDAGDGLPFARTAVAYLPEAELEISEGKILIRKSETFSPSSK